jgi:hypothetical protein
MSHGYDSDQERVFDGQNREDVEGWMEIEEEMR